MNRHLKAIRTKLSNAELAYLKDSFGVELRDPAILAALSDLDLARQQLEVFSAMIRSSHTDTGEPMICTFCGGSSTVAGPLVQAPSGACICRGCAAHCIAMIEKGHE